MKPTVIAVIVVAVVVALLVAGGATYHFVMVDGLQNKLARVRKTTRMLDVVPTIPDAITETLTGLGVPASATAAVLANRGLAQISVQRLEVERQVLVANSVTPTFTLPSVRWSRLNAIVSNHSAIVARDAVGAAREAMSLAASARDVMAMGVVAIEAATNNMRVVTEQIEAAVAGLTGARATPHQAAQVAVDAMMMQHREAAGHVRTARAEFETALAEHNQHVAAFQTHRAQAVADSADSAELVRESGTIVTDIAADIRRAAAVPLPPAARSPQSDTQGFFNGSGHIVEVDAPVVDGDLTTTTHPTMALNRSGGSFDVGGVLHTLTVSFYRSFLGPDAQWSDDTQWVPNAPIVLRGMAQVVTMGTKRVVVVKHRVPPIRTGVFIFYYLDTPAQHFKANISALGRVYDNRIGSRGERFGALTADNAFLMLRDGTAMARVVDAPPNAHDYRHTDSTGASRTVRFVEINAADNIPSEYVNFGRVVSGVGRSTIRFEFICGTSRTQASDNGADAVGPSGHILRTSDRWRTFTAMRYEHTIATFTLRASDGRWTGSDGSTYELT